MNEDPFFSLRPYALIIIADLDTLLPLKDGCLRINRPAPGEFFIEIKNEQLNDQSMGDGISVPGMNVRRSMAGGRTFHSVIAIVLNSYNRLSVNEFLKWCGGSGDNNQILEVILPFLIDEINRIIDIHAVFTSISILPRVTKESVRTLKFLVKLNDDDQNPLRCVFIPGCYSFGNNIEPFIEDENGLYLSLIGGWHHLSFAQSEHLQGVRACVDGRYRESKIHFCNSMESSTLSVLDNVLLLVERRKTNKEEEDSSPQKRLGILNRLLHGIGLNIIPGDISKKAETIWNMRNKIMHGHNVHISLNEAHRALDANKYILSEIEIVNRTLLRDARNRICALLINKK